MLLDNSDEEDSKLRPQLAEAKPKKRLKVKSAKAVESPVKTENAPSQASAAPSKTGRSSSEAIDLEGSEESVMKKQKTLSPNKETKGAIQTKVAQKD